jgi:hypothetical protein
MVKKCIICDKEAIYKIKDNPDFYCQECAEENFSDLDLLVKVEEEAQRLKAALKEKMVDLVLSEEELENALRKDNEFIDGEQIENKNDEHDDKDRED